MDITIVSSVHYKGIWSYGSFTRGNCMLYHWLSPWSALCFTQYEERFASIHSSGFKKSVNIIEISLAYIEALLGGLFNLEISFVHSFVHLFILSLSAI